MKTRRSLGKTNHGGAGKDCQSSFDFAFEARQSQTAMSTVKEIESAITQLDPKDVQAVADWLQEYREELWDKQIATDAKAGKLDSLIKKAKAGHHAGKATAFP